MRTAMSSCLFLLACGGAPTPSPVTLPVTTDVKDPIPTPLADPVVTVPSKPVTMSSLAAIGLDPAALDRKADPCENFYQFACGGWMAKTEISADKSIAMRSFVEIEDRNVEFLHQAFEKLVATPDKDPVHQKIAAYYGSCMDEAAIEKSGPSSIAAIRAQIDKVRDVKSLSTAVAQLHAAGFGALFDIGPTADAVDARNVIAGIDQGGLGLPDRDYYLETDDASKEVRVKYVAFLTAMLGEMGRRPDVAKSEAAAILALETEIARVSLDKVARRDPKATYNKIDKSGVAKAMPSFDWTGYWNGMGLAKYDGISVASPKYLEGLDKLLAATKPEVWRAYLTFHVASQAAGFLTSKIEKTQFAFESALTGQPEMEVRWKRCIASTSAVLPDLVGQVFVAGKFGGDSKTAAEGYVHAISDAMDQNLAVLPWMDATTKTKAVEKRKAMAYQIGYPSKWKSYDFKLDRKTYGANTMAGRRAETLRELAKIGKPLDRNDWGFPASLVNAFYSTKKNTMMFPAGILQPPFYSVGSSVSVNLGAMGMVVGHELTHGFDDQGAQFDGDGNLKNWWQAETLTKFKERTQCVVDQYSKYEVVGGTKLNGANTAGENIADIGGVKLAYTAFHKLRDAAPDAVVADGFTEDQQFFLSFGQAWCAKMRPELEKLLATTDVHSPAQWRINGAVTATPDFAKAFRCKAGAKLAPAKPCVVW